tara:strand:- start:4407 stop:4931 length:525 start_codon:yes stop_codon:yes gene_type:complete
MGSNNPWMRHLQLYRGSHPDMPLSECMKKASKSYQRAKAKYRAGSSSDDDDDDPFSVPPPPKRQKSEATLKKEREEKDRQEEEELKIYNEREVPKMNRQIERYRPKGKASLPDGFFELRGFANGPTLSAWPPRFQKLSPKEKRSVWISDIWGSDALRKIKNDKLLQGAFGKVKR